MFNESEFSVEEAQPLRYRNHTGIRHQKMQSLPFIAWDGEGYSDDEDEHHYMLFGNSLGEYVRSKSLTFDDCFQLLLSSEGKGINVIYGGDYDVIMMTKGMPFPVRERLLGGRPVKYGGYRMVWYRRKFLQLSDGSRSVMLYDAISFFQTSFVKACREYLGNDSVLDAMHQSKLRRDSFTFDDDSVIPYWQSELEYLVRLMGQLRLLLREVGIKPRGWYGPGAVASALLSAHRIGDFMEEPSYEISDFSERAYYGGRFEQFKIGNLNNVYEYDIRSAYPAAITLLPDLKDVTWRHESTVQTVNVYGLYCVSWDLPWRPWQVGPLPWRSDKGNVYYPLQGHKSWYWGIEVLNLIEHIPPKYWTLHEAWLPTFASSERPFSWVADMYAQRAQMKRDGNPAQLAVKLGMNSLYGKLAQSKGSKRDEHGAWIKPRWHQIMWAGWITAYTRHAIYVAATQIKGSIIAIETDAVFANQPLDLKLGEQLGEWEETTLDNILYIQSGVYYALRNGVWKLKTRGVEVDSSHNASYWVDIFKRLPGESLEVSIKVRRFGTVLHSSHYGNWFDYTRTVRLPFTVSKRIHHPKLCLACKMETGSYADVPHNLNVPEPLICSDAISSTPYSLPWREKNKFEWQPSEWKEILETGDRSLEWK